ncbi:LOW QUALITY PROTEIN: zinc finger protein 574 [Brachyhypopomus gauderio]|uniref:LOW QUALITY PROTEIN: zinc finger protein 574 n=1 Tax=Brachyhypopomus gauderio TaxID=698409 RepID=UPI0040427C7C
MIYFVCALTEPSTLCLISSFAEKVANESHSVNHAPALVQMMESSSVYMCFPCYREFPTLEEVLTHQLSCTAESSPALTTTTTPVEAAALAAGLPQLTAQSLSAAQVQCQVEADLAQVGAGLIQMEAGLSPTQDQRKVLPSSDTPRVLYQCADCELLFDALSLWQQHRKMGCCQEPDPGVEQEVVQEMEQGAEHMETVAALTLQAPAAEVEQGEWGESEVGVDASVEAHAPLMEKDPEGVITADPLLPSSAADGELERDPSDEQSPPVKRRGQKKAKLLSSLLCIECGQCFCLVAELMAHRKTAHGLRDAIHRCGVCGEGFINTTLFLYHRKQHRAQVEAGQRETASPVTQLSTALLEAPGEGLLLLATAGEGQSLMELAGLEALPEVVPVAQVEVELDEAQQDGQEVEEGVEVEVEGVESMEVEKTEEVEAQCEERTDAEAEQEAGEDERLDGGEEVGLEQVVAQVEAQVDALVEAEASDTGSSSSPSFLCSQCGSSFTAELELARHRTTEHGLAGALHTCEECGQEFMSTTQYLYHRRQHRGNSSAGLQSFPSARLNSALTSPAKQRDIILLRRAEPARVVTSAEPSAPPPDPAMEAPAKLSRDWSRTPLPHECPHCGRGFTRRGLLREHVFQHTGEKLFSCHVCHKSFPSPASLLRHGLTHGGARAFSCPVCARAFYQATSLKRHMLTHDEGTSERRGGGRGKGRGHSLGDGRLHVCPDCPASFKLDSQLQTHRLLHTSHPFPCSTCGQAFKRRKELDLHSLIHQDKEPKSCPQCGSQFLNQAVLDLHLQRCTGEPPPQRRRYKGHGRGRVGGQLECDMCGHRCVTQDGLDLHRLSHTGQTPLRCPLTPCRRRFASSSALAEHVLSHCRGALGKRSAPRRYACEYCAKEFAYASTFAVHMRTHTDERPFECTQCGKRFRQLPHLQDHERIHSGERPFACWVCGKSFSVAARLTEHARVHSGERPYACPRCPTAFRSRPNLDKHMRQHAGEPVAMPPVADDDSAAVQTILLVQEAASPSLGSAHAMPLLHDGTVVTEQHAPSVVFLHPGVGMPTVAMPAISLVEGQEVPHTIEFIIEETV